ncbi:gamma-mobile-trio recombinase GmtY [Paucibacter sp. XJ19-41]|uniref:gamma-mobile-trio recombinase GmtY n=1 Tax=Paucibacter sp. XJ19-41 TaxID=2927824 RepID=UPI00234BB590|nr:gamma-mobile-trio recombinase GmtY [Paucibacter sp. XJ19-41]MDC6168399.1 gamma-mobile-trio recombinase GmtY [Paucibacter sp. XJ19-41]
MFARVKVSVRSDNTGSSVDVPGLLTPGGLLTPLLDYFVEKSRSRSPSWMDKIVKSVRLFCYYIQANPHQRDTRALFDGFDRALELGTFNLATGEDPSGLCWRPHSAQDRYGIITDLTLFFDWMGKQNPVAANINPLVDASVYEQRWNAAARMHKRENSLLGHLWSNPESDKKRRRLEVRRLPVAKGGEPPAFPDDRFEDLIADGFRIGKRVDHRAICITLLMNGAGFRVSEPFHMFVQDAGPDPTNPATALVAIHHPEEGFAPEKWRDPSTGRRGTRSAYLASQYGLKPRNRIRGPLHAGWKGGLYDEDNAKFAHWFQPWCGEVFLYHWNLYLEQLAHVKRGHHPYLWVNTLRGDIGEPYKLGTFIEAHEAACRRIGLAPLKEAGTTDHGHRHAYGQRARRAGLDSKTVQVMLHHASEESQLIYTGPGTAEIQAALSEAHQRLGESIPSRFLRLISKA